MWNVFTESLPTEGNYLLYLRKSLSSLEGIRDLDNIYDLYPVRVPCKRYSGSGQELSRSLPFPLFYFYL
eukprot:gene8414-5895_t